MNRHLVTTVCLLLVVGCDNEPGSNIPEPAPGSLIPEPTIRMNDAPGSLIPEPTIRMNDAPGSPEVKWDKPAAEFRIGTVAATIWLATDRDRIPDPITLNTGAGSDVPEPPGGFPGGFEGRRMYNVAFSKVYYEGGFWKETNDFTRDDLLVIAKLADRAHNWIIEHGLGETVRQLSLQPKNDGQGNVYR